MLKWILFGLIAYFVYRFYIAPKGLGAASRRQDEIPQNDRQTARPEPEPENEYTDYEELD